MSGLYPNLFASVEDHACHGMLRSQAEAIAASAPTAPPTYDGMINNQLYPSAASLYPELTSFMGVELTSNEIQELTNSFPVQVGFLKSFFYILNLVFNF